MALPIVPCVPRVNTNSKALARHVEQDGTPLQGLRTVFHALLELSLIPLQLPHAPRAHQEPSAKERHRYANSVMPEPTQVHQVSTTVPNVPQEAVPLEVVGLLIALLAFKVTMPPHLEAQIVPHAQGEPMLRRMAPIYA